MEKSLKRKELQVMITRKVEPQDTMHPSCYKTQLPEAKTICFNDETRKEAVVLATYYYIRELFLSGLISENELYTVKRKYNID